MSYTVLVLREICDELKMETVTSSETSVSYHNTIRLHIPGWRLRQQGPPKRRYPATKLHTMFVLVTLKMPEGIVSVFHRTETAIENLNKLSFLS